MSTTFMGRSRPLEDMWRQTPRSAEPAQTRKKTPKIDSVATDTRTSPTMIYRPLKETSYPAGRGNLPPPATGCKCSRAADAERRSASCSVPSEDLYLEHRSTFSLSSSPESGMWRFTCDHTDQRRQRRSSSDEALVRCGDQTHPGSNRRSTEVRAAVRKPLVPSRASRRTEKSSSSEERRKEHEGGVPIKP